MNRRDELDEMYVIIRKGCAGKICSDGCPGSSYDYCGDYNKAVMLYDAGWRKQIEAEWTGILSRDYAHAEGIPSYATPEERKAYHDMFHHITHCSNCQGMFDDRQVRYWAYCPYCGAKMKKGD